MVVGRFISDVRMRLSVIGWYILCWIVGILMVIFLGGCCHRTYESIVRDTVTIHTVDSVIVNMREVEVEVPVPQITLQERIPLCDTLLVLDNGLYQSTVDIRDGQVTHTLAPSPPQSVPGGSPAGTIHTTVHVPNTTKISNTVTTSTHTEKEKEHVVQPTVDSWWDKFKRSLGWFLAGLAVGVILAVLGFVLVRRW